MRANSVSSASLDIRASTHILNVYPAHTHTGIYTSHRLRRVRAPLYTQCQLGNKRAVGCGTRSALSPNYFIPSIYLLRNSRTYCHGVDGRERVLNPLAQKITIPTRSREFARCIPLKSALFSPMLYSEKMHTKQINGVLSKILIKFLSRPLEGRMYFLVGE